MLRWIKNVDGELEKNRALQNRGQLLVDLGWKWNEDACTVQVSRVLFPVVVLFISLLCPGAFLEGQPRHEHEKDGEEEWTKDSGVESFVSLAMDVAIGCWRYCNHVDAYRILVYET
jgi:hypothetical protein